MLNVGALQGVAPAPAGFGGGRDRRAGSRRVGVVAAEVARILRRVVLHVEVGGFQTLVALYARLQRPIEDAAGQQGALHGVRRLTGRQELLDLHRQRLEERGARRRRQEEQGRIRLLFAGDAGGEGRVIDVAVEQQHRRLEAVAVLHDERYRPLREGGPARRRGELPAVVADVADVERRAAAQGVLQQLPRPDAVVAGLPDGVALQAGDSLDALLALRPPL